MLDKNNASNAKGKSLKGSNHSAEEIASSVVYKSLNQVMHESMMPYSEFVIMDRALPRVEDGLKPVQRRVLYSMLEVGVTPDKPYRKSARIVGDCMGKYHPHGDKSIYDTMVRMAQSFNMGETLVDGHGNYGSVDGDGAAAMRYTEARLTPISLELLKDIEKDTVSWSFNFDDSIKEPDMLPGRFPNLLVNGATGIAVGLATNIPTHNLSETISAVCAYIDNKKITIDELLAIMPAPDFSTGAYILDSSELKQIYQTGRGKVIMRAKHHIENADNGKKNIVITEIPYQVNKASMLQKIAKLKENDDNGVYAGIYEIVDESDRTGTRAVLKLKKDTNIGLLLQSLYKQSDLQVNFNVNMVAIAGGKPKLLSLQEIIEYYVNYQKQVIFNRTKYDLAVSEKRAHILAGLIIAIKNIDEVIRIIKQSKSVNEARLTLQEVFILTEIQAQAILDMRLARLTNLEVNKIETELADLLVLIEKLKQILASDRLQLNLVKSEMLLIKDKYGSPRKSEIICDDLEVISETYEDVLAGEAEYEHIIYSAGNTLKAVQQKNYNLSTKELSVNANLTEVPHINLTVLNSKSVYLLTNLGNCHKVKVRDIPKFKFKEKGEFIYNIVKSYEQNEKVVAMFDLDESNEEDELVFVTKYGFVKITKANEYLSSKQTIAAIKLKADDEVISVIINNPSQNLTMFSNAGYALTFEKKDVTVSGRVSMGVKGIGLSDDDFVVNAYQIHAATAFVLFTDNGFAKVIKNSEVPFMVRTRKGLRVINGIKKDIKLVNAFMLDKNINFVTESSNGDLGYVVNRKLVLEDRLGMGKNALATKAKGIKLSNTYKYEVSGS